MVGAGGAGSDGRDAEESKALASNVPEFSPLPPDTQVEITSFEPAKKESVWNPDKHTALVQATLAKRLIWVLSGVLLGGAALLATTKWTGLQSKDVTNFFGVAFGAVVTLATAATSFWFGIQKGKSGPPSL